MLDTAVFAAVAAPLGPPVSRSLSLGRAKLGPEGSPEDDESRGGEVGPPTVCFPPD